MNLTSVRSERIYIGCCGQDYYTDITFYINLRRKPLFYTVNLVMPCMLIAFLTTFVFYLTDHKVTFAISVLVALSVFWLVLVDLIPPNSEVIPLFGQYLMFTMALVSMSIFATVCIMNIHYRNSSTHGMSPWMRIVFLKFLPKILRLKVPQWNEDIDSKTQERRKILKYSIEFDEKLCGAFNRCPAVNYSYEDNENYENFDSDSTILKRIYGDVIREITKNFNVIADHLSNREEESKVLKEVSPKCNTVCTFSRFPKIGLTLLT